MTARIVLLHTRPGDADIYDQVKKDLAPTAKAKHVVRRDWRARALREGLTWQLRREIDNFVRGAAAPVVCTCPILGDAAEFAGAVRIDRPAMRLAACGTGTMLLVTVDIAAMEPALAALEEAMATHANDNAVFPLVLKQFLRLYEQGDLPGFYAAVAAAVIEALQARPDLSTVILAENCMQPVAGLLAGAGLNMITIPEHGLRKAFGLQARESLGDPITT